jgi:hypothetical protein
MTRLRLLTPLLILVLVGSVAAPAVGDTALPQPVRTPASRPGRLIELRADPTNRPYHVSVPAALAQKMKRPGAQSATITVNYNPGFTPEAQAAFQAAVDIWAALISSQVEIKVDAYWMGLGTGVLGSAGPCQFFRDFLNAPVSGAWYPVALANSMASSDLDPNGDCNTVPGGYDIRARFNSNLGLWYLGTDGNTPNGQYDLMSVVLHELGHGLGFTGSMDSGPPYCSDSAGCWGDGNNPNNPFIYDKYVVNGANQVLIDSFPNNSAEMFAQFTSGNLFFNGPKTMQANNGNAAKLYAPATWSGGSSIAHLDEDTYLAGNANALMTPFLSDAESTHNPGPITLCMFKDMGWQVDTSLVTTLPVPLAQPAGKFDPLTAPIIIFLPLVNRTGTAC